MAETFSPSPVSVDEPARVVEVIGCYSPKAGQVVEVPLRLPTGTCVNQAIALIQEQTGWSVIAAQSFGIWGRLVDGAYELQSGDRLEFYRALTVDPKVARRQRFKKQGAKRSGLFAKRRPGAVAGY